MALASLIRFVALSCTLLLLDSGGAAAGHIHNEDTEVGHHCALCMTQSLSLFHEVQTAPCSFLTAVRFLLPGPQGPPLCALYRGCLLSRAPPVPA